MDGTSEEVKHMVSKLNSTGNVIPRDIVDVVVSPPYPFLLELKKSLHVGFYVAAQNCCDPNDNDLTGEVSADALVNLAIPWVILGHFDRRGPQLNESDEFVGDKVAYALSQGLKVIACVGEISNEKNMSVVTNQLKAIAGAEAGVSTRIIYGGSVNGTNCKEFAKQPDIDGFLVGKASLKPAEFVYIIKSAPDQEID